MRLAAIQEALSAANLDGWLFFDHHIRDPLAYRVLKFVPPQTPTRRWYYFIPSTGAPSKIVHRIEAGMLEALPGTTTRYAGWESQASALQNALQGTRRIAMQYSPDCAIPYVSMVDAGTVEMVRSLGVEVASSADLIQQFEATWDAEQLEMHVEAGRRVDRVRRSAFDLIGARLNENRTASEFEIHMFIRESFSREGLITDHGPIVAVNDNIADPHYEPTSASTRPIQSGDVVLIDMWAKLDQQRAVYYDITWTGFCGANPPEKVREIFQCVTGARDAAVAFVQASIAANRELLGFQVDDAARGHIASHGFGEYFFHRTGHSIGEDVHGTGANMDNLETHDERRVLLGTCFSIEPGIYLPEFGIRSEVNMFIKANEAIVTGEIQRELVQIGA